MKNRYLPLILLITLLQSFAVRAGDPDRSGGAGGTQLLLNPYARSAGMMGSNTAYLKGAEAMHYNVGGLGFVKSFEVLASTAVYLQGTGINLSNVSLAIPLGESGENVIGLSFSGMQFGNINITTESQPDGTLGTYSPQIVNLGLSFAKRFSNSISAGLLVRYLSEGISNVTATGMCFDMGVQYQTALNPKNKIKKEDFRFGISVRNLGSNLTYGGSGMSFKTIIPSTGATRTTYMGSESYNLPALVHIGASYDIKLDKKGADSYFHRLTPSGNFNYNAFSSNAVSFGAEYAFKEMFMLRTGYCFQSKTTSSDFTTVYTGFAGGCTIQLPLTASGTNLGIDYSYAPTRIFNGIHNVTLRISIGSKKS